MAAVGGSIESVALDGRIFSVAADADSNRKMGGFENEVQSNGDGTGRLLKTRVPSSIDGLTLSIDEDRGDAEYLQELQDRPDFFPVAVTYASGVVWQGDMQITGEVTISSANATASVALMGTATLSRQ